MADIETLRARWRTAELAAMAARLDAEAMTLHNGPMSTAVLLTAVRKRRDMLDAGADLDNELWWSAVLADPRIEAHAEGEARASLRAAERGMCDE